MPEELDEKLTLDGFYTYRIAIIGLGGTGSHLVSSLLQLIGSSPLLASHAKVILIDGDRVEPKNLRNQKYLPEDIGKTKSEALYTRYQDVYPSVELSYFPRYIENTNDLEQLFGLESSRNVPTTTLDIIVGCVDNLKARKTMDDYFKKRTMSRNLVYIDTGNGIGDALTGQTVVGRSTICKEKTSQTLDAPSVVEILPPPSAYFPEILSGEDEEREISCGDLDETMVQNLGANIMSACNVFNILNNVMVFKRIPGNLFLFDAHKNKLTQGV